MGGALSRAAWSANKTKRTVQKPPSPPIIASKFSRGQQTTPNPVRQKSALEEIAKEHVHSKPRDANSVLANDGANISTIPAHNGESHISAEINSRQKNLITASKNGFQPSKSSTEPVFS